MQKIQVFLRDDQKAALKSLSAQTGMRQSDLIRQGVDLLLQSEALQARDWREAMRAVVGIWRDRDDLDETSEKFRSSLRSRFPSVYRS